MNYKTRIIRIADVGPTKEESMQILKMRNVNMMYRPLWPNPFFQKRSCQSKPSEPLLRSIDQSKWKTFLPN